MQQATQMLPEWREVPASRGKWNCLLGGEHQSDLMEVTIEFLVWERLGHGVVLFLLIAFNLYASAYEVKFHFGYPHRRARKPLCDGVHKGLGFALNEPH